MPLQLWSRNAMIRGRARYAKQHRRPSLAAMLLEAESMQRAGIELTNLRSLVAARRHELVTAASAALEMLVLVLLEVRALLTDLPGVRRREQPTRLLVLERLVAARLRDPQAPAATPVAGLA